MFKKLSIVIPVFNMEDSLESSIYSIINQSYKNFEVILINDGSTDETKQICDKIEKSYSLVKVWHTKNRGSGPARNLGLSKATGDYIYFMDADDKLYYDAFFKLMNYASDFDPDVIVFGYKKKDENSKNISTKVFNYQFLTGTQVRYNYQYYFDTNFKYAIQGAPWNKLFKTDILRDVNVRFPSLKRHQDEVFISKFIDRASSIMFVPDILYTHYINSLSDRFKKYPVDYINCVKELFEYRKKIIRKWNENNQQLNSLIYIEYYYNLLKACDLVFSPYFKSTKKEKIRWLKKELEDVELKKELIRTSNYNNKLKTYQILFFLTFLKKNNYGMIYIFCKLRVMLEKRMKYFINFLKIRAFSKVNRKYNP